MEQINASIGFDYRLARVDIMASRVHCRMLMAQNIIAKSDGEKILTGLDQIANEIAQGRFQFKIAHEDIHMNIEARLHELIGAAAGRLHTARSRNDQVATDFRLWIRLETDEIENSIRALQSALIAQAETHYDKILPGPDPFPSGAACDVWALFTGLCRDVGARSRAIYRCAGAVKSMSVGVGGFGGDAL